jgi:hypothetical protein
MRYRIKIEAVESRENFMPQEDDPTATLVFGPRRNILEAELTELEYEKVRRSVIEHFNTDWMEREKGKTVEKGSKANDVGK